MGRTVITTYAYPDADTVPPAIFTDLAAGTGQIRCVGNKYHNGFSSVESDSVVTAGTFSNDQFCSSAVSGGFAGGANGDQIGVSVRCSTDTGAGRDMYRAYVNDATVPSLVLQRIVDGTTTTLGTSSALGWGQNKRVEIECIGSTIRALRDGNVLISVIDTALTTGRPGIYAFVGSNDTLRGDDTQMGNVFLSPADIHEMVGARNEMLSLERLEDDSEGGITLAHDVKEWW